MILPITLSLISSVGVCCAFEKPRVFVEIIPRDLVDVVAKPIKQSALTGRPIDNTLGCESINDAVIHAKRIGFALLGNVIPENLFFFFGESVQGLREAFFEFNIAYKIAYNSEDFYAPIYSHQGYRTYECNTEPLAIVLCKLKDAESFRKLVIDKQKYPAKDTDCYQVSWSQLQRLYDLLNSRHV